MACNSCPGHDPEDPAKKGPVPRATHESDMDRADRANKRLFAALIVVVLLWFATVALGVWAWTRYDYCSEVETYTQDGEGLNIIGDRNTASLYGADSQS